jgi:DNA-binding beta-propeller fold protein YncE
MPYKQESLSIKAAVVALSMVMVALTSLHADPTVPTITAFSIELGARYAVDVAPTETGDSAFVLFNGPYDPIRVIDPNSRSVTDTFNPMPEEFLYYGGGFVVGRTLFASTAFDVVAVDIDTHLGTFLFKPSPLVGGFPCELVPAPMRDRLYTISNQYLVSIDPIARNVVATTPLPFGLNAIAVSQDGQIVYVADSRSGTLSRYSAVDLHLVGITDFTTPTMMLGSHVSITIDPSGKVYIGYLDSAFGFALTVTDSAGVQIRSTSYPFFSEGLATTKDGHFLITGAGYIIDRESLSVVYQVQSGIGAYRVRVTEDGHRAYISNYNSSFLTVLEITPSETSVSIDIKPGSSANPIQLRRSRIIPVAILTTSDFDATTVDPSTVCFGNADAPAERACSEVHDMGHVEDVDEDGDLDLLLHYFVSQTGIAPGDTEACLTGMTLDGTQIEGCDRIQILTLRRGSASEPTP